MFAMLPMLLKFLVDPALAFLRIRCNSDTPTPCLISTPSCCCGGRGLTLGLGFGLGAVAVPTIVYGIGVAYFGNRLRAQLGHWRRHLENLSAGLLILVGLSNLAR